jgi:hypothetical protein
VDCGSVGAREIRGVGGVELLAFQSKAKRLGLGDPLRREFSFGMATEAAFDVAKGFGMADEENGRWHDRQCKGVLALSPESSVFTNVLQPDGNSAAPESV